MRFHMTFLSTYLPDRDPPVADYYAQVLEQIQLAEELGWECWWFTEHHFIQYGGLVPNPAVMMAAAAARTSRMRVGSAVSLVPLRHPLHIAEDYAMVDVASRGRLEFGVGRGNTPFDYEAFGVPHAESAERLAEALEIIQRVWRGERAAHQGKYWQYPELALYPRPVQQPHPPIWVAGSSPASLGRAGEQGHNVMIVAHPFPPEQVRVNTDAWRAGLAAGGHDPSTRHCKVHLRIWVDDNAERAQRTAEAALTAYDEVNVLSRGAGGRVHAGMPGYDWEGMRAQGRNVYGTPDEVIQGMQATRAHYDFDTWGTQLNFGGIPHEQVLKSMRLFAREVMPAFQ